MATQKEVIISVKIDGEEKVEKKVFSLKEQLDAIAKLGFGKAIAQGFIEGREEIEAATKALQEQAAQVERGTPEYEKIQANVRAAETAVKKFADADIKAQNERLKAAEKLESETLKAFQTQLKEKEKAEKDAAKASAQIRKDAIKSAVAEAGGFAKAFADGTISSLADIEFAFNELKKTKPLDDKDFLDARAAVKVFGSTFREFGGDTEKVIKDLNTGINSVTSQFFVFNEETQQSVLNTEALQAAYKDLEPAINNVTDSVKELDLVFDDLTIPALKAEIEDASISKLEKELVGLQDKFEALGNEQVGSARWVELQEKIGLVQTKLEEVKLPDFSDLSLIEVRVEIDKRSKAQLEKQKEDLEADFAKLKPIDAGYKEAAEKLKLVNKALIDIELQTEAIKDTDLAQAYVDIGTKAVEGVNNLVGALGALSGAGKEAAEVQEKLDQALQIVAVVQSGTDAYKAYQESLKGVNISALTAGGGLKVLKLALAASGIGAIVLVVTALISQFGGLQKILGIISDGFDAAKDAFQAFAANITFEGVLKRVKDFGAALVEVYTAPFKAIGDFTTEFFKSGSFTQALDSAKTSISKSVDVIKKGTVDQFKGLGDTLADAFGKSFDARQGLRENERKKKLLETLNAERAARKTVLDANLADATLTFAEQAKLIKQAGALEQAAIADSLKLNRERIGLLRSLGKNLSEEQKDELRELTKETAQQQADLQALQIAAIQARRQALVDEQDFKLAQLQAATDFAVAQDERALQKGIEFGQLSVEAEKKFIDEIQSARAGVLDKEVANIKARGKLTKDEQDRLVEIERERVAINQETEDKIIESRRRRFDEASALAAKEIELAQKGLDGAALELAAQQRLADAANERLARETELANRNQVSIQKIKEANERSNEAIEEARDRQIEQLEATADLELQNIDLQKQSLALEITRLQTKQAAGEATAEEIAQIEILNKDVENLGVTADNVKLNLTLDKEGVVNEALDQSKAAADELRDKLSSVIADPIGSKLKEALVSGLSINEEDAQLILDSFGGVLENVLALTDQIFQAQAEAQQNQIDNLATQIEDVQKYSEQIQGELDETFANIEALEGRLATSRGANQEAVLAQLENQKKKEKELLKAKEDAAKKEKQLEAEKAKREAEKAETEKKQARLSLAIDTAKAYASLAIGVANATQVPFPANIAAIAATVAAGLAAIVSTISLAKFKKGGVIKAAGGMVLSGPSHDFGGVPISVKGGAPIEAEGGEIILTKGVYENPALRAVASNINVAGGGKKFADGGAIDGASILAQTANISFPMAEMTAAFSAAAQQIRPVVAVTDITDRQNSLSIIDSKASF